MVDVERFGPMRVEAALETPFQRVGVGRHLTSPRMDIHAVVAVLRIDTAFAAASDLA